jgi:hypothetical protein
VVWQAAFPAHHDIEPAPGGRLLALSSVERISEEFGSDRYLIDDQVLVLDKAGKTQAEYSLYEMFVASPQAITFGRYRRVERRNERKVVDAFHTNSVQWITAGKLAGKHAVYRDGNILICMRHQNLIAIFDPKRRRFVWSWGRGKLEGPHSARMLANGNIIVFDNGLQRRSSRILEIDPRRDEIVWRYEATPLTDFFSPYGGSCQRMTNGNTFIAETHRGTLFEVDAKGETVWRYVNPAEDAQKPRRATIHSAKRLAASYVESVLRRRPSATATPKP